MDSRHIIVVFGLLSFIISSCSYPEADRTGDVSKDRHRGSRYRPSLPDSQSKQDHRARVILRQSDRVSDRTASSDQRHRWRIVFRSHVFPALRIFRSTTGRYPKSVVIDIQRGEVVAMKAEDLLDQLMQRYELPLRHRDIVQEVIRTYLHVTHEPYPPEKLEITVRDSKEERYRGTARFRKTTVWSPPGRPVAGSKTARYRMAFRVTGDYQFEADETEEIYVIETRSD